MLIVRGTKKLRDRLKAAPAPAADDASTTALGDWFATVLFWKPQVVMLVNTRTFLPVFMPFASAATLRDRIPAAIAEVLDRHGVPLHHIDDELAEMSDTRLAPTNDRRVLGVMNEFVFQVEHQRHRLHGDLLALSLEMSRMILGPLMTRERRPANELAAVFASDAEVAVFPSSLEVGDRKAPRPQRAGRAVHQLKVTLRGIDPPVWRRVVVDGGESLNHLHDVIQAAFGWQHAHLHEFEIDGIDYGIPSEDDWTPVQDDRQCAIDQVIGAGNFEYTYDFGDHWDHAVVVEKTFAADTGGMPTTVPDCIDGRRSCPPEDCGGPSGYADLLEILADPRHPEHADRVAWLGPPFDPEAFDASSFADDLEFARIMGLNEEY